MKSLHHKAPRVSPLRNPNTAPLPCPQRKPRPPSAPAPPPPPPSPSPPSPPVQPPPVHLREHRFLEGLKHRFLLFIIKASPERSIPSLPPVHQGLSGAINSIASSCSSASQPTSILPDHQRASGRRILPSSVYLRSSDPASQISRVKMAMHKRKRIQDPDSIAKGSETKRKRPSSSPSRVHNSRRQTIDDYKTVSVIYQSFEGLIFQATHRMTGEVVAVKVQHLDGNLPPEVIFHSAASDKTPRIIRLREVIVDHGDVYMVMDFVKDDLRSLLVHRFDEERVRTVMRHLLEGLSHIHHLDILHRDISPENLLVTPDGAICICDFGLACKSNGAYPAGKLPYCAPEMLIGVVYGTAVDIWAAGCVMYELLFNKKLFEGYDEMDVLDNIFYSLGKPSEKEWPELYECPLVKKGELDLKGVRDDQDGLGDIVPYSELSYYGFDLLSRMLTINPQHRISASAALMHPWFDDD